MKISKSELNFLNQLTIEIIILDREYRIIWLNDSALNKGWVIDSNKDKNLIAQVATENEEADTLKISVTGTRSPRETKNVPSSVTVIDKNEIDNRGITDFRELFKELLSTCKVLVEMKLLALMY